MTRTKTCTRCGTMKSLDEFPPQKERRDGRKSWCRECCNGYQAERRATDEEYVERRRAANNAWRKDNPERARAATVEGWLEKKNRRARHNARKYGVVVDDVNLFEIFEREGWMCCVCGDPIDRSRRHPDRLAATIEHVVPLSRGGGHVEGNIRVSHHTCNERKRTRTLEELGEFNG